MVVLACTTFQSVFCASASDQESGGVGYKFYPRIPCADVRIQTVYAFQYGVLSPDGSHTLQHQGYLFEDAKKINRWQMELTYAFGEQENLVGSQIGKIVLNDDGTIETFEYYDPLFSIALLVNSVLEGFPKKTTNKGVLFQRSSILDTKETCCEQGMQNIRLELAPSRLWRVDYRFVNNFRTGFDASCNGINVDIGGEKRGRKTRRRAVMRFSWRDSKESVLRGPKLDYFSMLLSNDIEAFRSCNRCPINGKEEQLFEDISNLRELLLTDLTPSNDGIVASAVSYTFSALSNFRSYMDSSQLYTITLVSKRENVAGSAGKGR